MSVYVVHSGEREGGQLLNQWNHAVSHWKLDGELGYDDPLPEGHTLVVLSPVGGYRVQGTESLVDFVHPENVVYWFGSNHVHMQPNGFPREPDHLVFIPADPYEAMYSWVAMAIVMYDRGAKRG